MGDEATGAAGATDAMDATGAVGRNDGPPDRLAIDPRSPFFDGDLLARGIGVRFKGRVRTDVDEYCLSEQWIRVAAGKSRDRSGMPITIKLTGPLEVWFEDAAADGGAGGATAAADASGGGGD